MSSRTVYQEILSRLLKTSNPTRHDVERVKVEVSRLYGLGSIPRNSDVLKETGTIEAQGLLELLRRKHVRTISGVTVVAVMCAPHPCPHGKCAYCPGGPEFGVPQSYTGREPAALRGIQNEFNPYKQARSRVKQLEEIGHVVDKVELIIMGGNFTSTSDSYQEDFIKNCLDALSNVHSGSFQEAKKIAETSRIRNVGITVESRPDWSKKPQINRMLDMGVTRVELGVQTLYDDVYRMLDRGHSVNDVVEATKQLKDSGLKVCYHMMPGLPGLSFEQDLKSFQRIFSEPEFKPDMVKVYPTLVLRGTKIYEWWVRGEYTPPSTEQMVELLLEIKKLVPPWVRIMRVQRDIPAPLIVAGVNRSNLRELVGKRLEQEGVRCMCIRCREVGHRMLRCGVAPCTENLRLLRRKYEASDGEDVFISVEDTVNDVLVGYLRLRIPSQDVFRPEIVRGDSSIVRELHVCGPMVSVGSRSRDAWQHRGYGKILLSEAEKISREDYGFKKILVTSALGTKQYYLSLGYMYDGVYVSKMLEE